MTDYPIERIAQDHADDRTADMEAAYHALRKLTDPGSRAAVLRAVKAEDEAPITAWVKRYRNRLLASMREHAEWRARQAA